MTVLKWAMVHHRLEVDEYDTLADAVASAVYAADDGNEALVCLEEVVEGETQIHSAREVWDVLAESIRAEQRTEWENQPEPHLLIDIDGPDGEGTAREWWSNDADATQERLQWWRSLVGAERVRLIDKSEKP